MDLKEHHMSEDGGIFLASFLRATIEYVNSIMKSDSNGGLRIVNTTQYSINPMSRRVVLQTKPIKVGSAAFSIRFFIDKDLQMVQVRLIELGDDADSYKMGMDLGTQYIDLDVSNVSSIETVTGSRYSSMTKLPETLNLISTQINNGYKSVYDVVSDIIRTTVEYAYRAVSSKQVTGNGMYPLPNGMNVDYIFANNGNVRCNIAFGDVLARSVKLDALFI